MATLIYAPEVQILIATSPYGRGKGKVIDVSEDVSSGSITRVNRGISSANFVLLNQSRKYDGLFGPMDRVVIYLRRIRKVLKFAGYLDFTPLWSAEPGSLSVRASCSLKRLANFYWDPGSPAASILLNKINSGDNFLEDGGVARIATDVMTQVVGWPKGSIHISRVPSDWFDTVSALADQLVAESEALDRKSVV